MALCQSEEHMTSLGQPCKKLSNVSVCGKWTYEQNAIFMAKVSDGTMSANIYYLHF